MAAKTTPDAAPDTEPPKRAKAEPHSHDFKQIVDKDGTPAPDPNTMASHRCQCGATIWKR